MLDIETRNAIRMVGYLLEHHPTTGEGARDRTGNAVACTSSKASCFCILGAVKAVTCAISPDPNSINFYYQVMETIENTFPDMVWPTLVDQWEGPNTSPETRLAIARKLQQA